jgi:cytoskeletal protein CcmA (bactofilin family)
MAISGFNRAKSSGEGAAPSSPRAEAPGALTAFIDQGSQFEGKLSFKDTVRIDGGFQGEIASENTLIVGESGEVQATIHSQVVVVSGTVIGDIVAKRQVVLHKTAKLEGNVSTPSLVVEEGAILNGNLSMGKASDSDKSTLKNAGANGKGPAANQPGSPEARSTGN